MKYYLLPENGNFYKANLHSHSTVSDGQLTPSELKEKYKAHGYSVFAFTDHELLVDHSDLSDKDFLAITGVEYAFVEKEQYATSRTIEFNMFAKDPHNVTQVCFNPKNIFHGEKWRADEAKIAGDIFEREYTLECMQTVIDEARKNGFLVSLNHPGYSMETPEFFGSLEGLFAMEIYNHISLKASGVNEYSPAIYDDMLRRGKRIACIASDDCHMGCPDDDPYCDRYGGFVMIKAEKLEYSDIINALENGDFYASQGPEINELYIEENKIHIKCSPAKYIAMNSSNRNSTGVRFGEDSKPITEAVFDLAENTDYFRFDVCDEYGNHANTRGYFVKDLKL